MSMTLTEAVGERGLVVKIALNGAAVLAPVRSYNLTKKIVYARIKYYCFCCIMGFSWPGESYFF